MLLVLEVLLLLLLVQMQLLLMLMVQMEGGAKAGHFAVLAVHAFAVRMLRAHGTGCWALAVHVQAVLLLLLQLMVLLLDVLQHLLVLMMLEELGEEFGIGCGCRWSAVGGRRVRRVGGEQGELLLLLLLLQ